jgi:hypothetical protein
MYSAEEFVIASGIEGSLKYLKDWTGRSSTVLEVC